MVVPPAVIANGTAEGIWSGMKAKQPILITGTVSHAWDMLVMFCHSPNSRKERH